MTFSRRIRSFVEPAATALLFFVLWEAVCRLFQIPEFVLPAPSVTIAALFREWGLIWPNAQQTLITTLLGFCVSVVFGMALGVLVGSSPFLNRCLSPLLVAFNSVPKVAVVPVLVLWFGIGTVPAVITAFVLSFFPITVNVAAGVAATDRELIDVLRSLGASRTDVIFKAGIPRSLPYFFASLKIAITLAFVGSVIAETVASNDGIGYLMLSASAAFKIPLVFASLLFIGILGVSMYAVTAFLENRLTAWNVHTGDQTPNFAAGG
jgi:NitT/TauT family transport system permease protein